MKNNQPGQKLISAETKLTAKKVWMEPNIEVIGRGKVESGSTTGGHEGQPTVLFPTFGGHYSS